MDNFIFIVTRSKNTLKAVIEALWKNANALVDPDRPGDLNQSLMELGATVCSPKSPQCSKCPVSSHCSAFKEVERQKDENKCKLANVKVEELGDIEDLVEGT